ncbi:MAG: twin-arginine translocase TatA/TatE family subunit [Candidatus Dormiibacterota bacterium]
MGFVGGHLPEIIIVLVVILIIWGPGKLPDVGAGIGKGIREFRKASSETHDAVMGTTTTTAQPAPVAQAVVAPAPAPAPAQPAEPVTVPADATTHQPSVSG